MEERERERERETQPGKGTGGEELVDRQVRVTVKKRERREEKHRGMKINKEHSYILLIDCPTHRM